MSARSSRLGASGAGILLAIAVFLGVNYLALRHWKRFDWTHTQIYSLSDTTKKILAGLKQPVQVTVFMTQGSSRLLPEVKELLARYQAASPKIEVEYLDPRRNMARAEALVKEAGVKENTVVFRSGDRKKYVEEDKLADFDFSGMTMGGGAPSVKAFKGEEAFTSAILSVTEAKQPKVYFSKGHGEAAIDSSERMRGFADARQILERSNMTVGTWDGLGKDNLPADADLIIVGGPRTAFLEPEAGALAKYLAGGGHALLLLDPILPGPGASPQDLGFSALLGKYGIRLGNDLVVDPANALPMIGAETVLANRWGTSPIVSSLAAEGLPVILPLARSVTKPEKPPEGLTAAMLVETSPEGWGETNLKNLDAGIKKDPEDTQGPVSLAVSLSAADAKAEAKMPRLVVIGNSRFAANGAIENGANGMLFANAAHWLVGSEKQVGIPPKTPAQTSLSMTDAQVNRLAWAAVVGLPGLAVLLGFWVWYRRRD
ncbi:MAG TPA: GldG family protein [Thermoanaerobaculia bacterium]|nr:GldG family protein [Thermoanaerobaculia bacterium]